MDFDKAKNATMKIILQSFVYYINEVLSEDFNEEELEKIMNVVLNVMTNSLYPDTALMWNNAIFNKIKLIKEYENKIEQKKVMEEIFQELGWKNDST